MTDGATRDALFPLVELEDPVSFADGVLSMGLEARKHALLDTLRTVAILVGDRATLQAQLSDERIAKRDPRGEISDLPHDLHFVRETDPTRKAISLEVASWEKPLSRAIRTTVVDQGKDVRDLIASAVRSTTVVELIDPGLLQPHEKKHERLKKQNAAGWVGLMRLVRDSKVSDVNAFGTFDRHFQRDHVEHDTPPALRVGLARALEEDDWQVLQREPGARRPGVVRIRVSLLRHGPLNGMFHDRFMRFGGDDDLQMSVHLGHGIGALGDPEPQPGARQVTIGRIHNQVYNNVRKNLLGRVTDGLSQRSEGSSSAKAAEWTLWVEHK